MMTRIVVAVLGILLFFWVMFFLPPVAMGILIGLISMIAAYELLSKVLLQFKIRYAVYTGISSVILCISSGLDTDRFYRIVIPVCFFLLLVLFLEMMGSYGKKHALTLSDIATIMLAGSIMPMLLSSIVRVNAFGPMWSLGILIVTFSSDSGAYFVGTFFGKHKLCPQISPKKTVEGAVGGALSAVLLMLLYGVLLSSQNITVNYFILAVQGLLGSIACQLGDLSFSIIKRHAGIKDYGNLLPGHGGMLDRFDSMHFTAPMIEILFISAGFLS